MKFFLIILLLTKIMILESLSIRGIQFIDNKTDYFNKKMSLEIETRICIEICSECFDYDESGIKVIVINTVKVSFLARDQARVNFYFLTFHYDHLAYDRNLHRHGTLTVTLRERNFHCGNLGEKNRVNQKFNTW